MTRAMVDEAARIVAEHDLKPEDIVSFVEVGSEGAVLRFNAFATDTPMGERWLIARDGTSRRYW